MDNPTQGRARPVRMLPITAMAHVAAIVAEGRLRMATIPESSFASAGLRDGELRSATLALIEEVSDDYQRTKVREVPLVRRETEA